MWRRDGIWTQQDELTAALLETLDFWGRQHAVIQGVKPRYLPRPVQVPRPGEQPVPGGPEEPRVETDPNVIAAFFARTGQSRN